MAAPEPDGAPLVRAGMRESLKLLKVSVWKPHLGLCSRGPAGRAGLAQQIVGCRYQRQVLVLMVAHRWLRSSQTGRQAAAPALRGRLPGPVMRAPQRLAGPPAAAHSSGHSSACASARCRRMPAPHLRIRRHAC